MKRLAIIEITRDFVRSDVTFKKGETYLAEILSIGFSGGFDRHNNDTMEGSIEPCAIIHIYEVWPDSNQKAKDLLLSIIIDYHAIVRYRDDI